MCRSVGTAAAIAFWAIVLAATPARAQTPPLSAQLGEQPAPATVPANQNGPAVEASPLDTFLLRDSKGNLVPVLDLPFEEFERLLRLKRGLAPPPPPAFTLDALSISGAVDRGRADLQVSLTVRVRESGLVRVPLGLGQAVLRQPVKYEGPGEHFLTHEEADGYLLWLSAAGNKPHVVTLQVSAPISPVAGESRLYLELPRATESSLRIAVPAAHAESRMVAGDGIISAKDLGGGRSELTVLGPAGDLELAWQPGRGSVAARPSPLESSGEIVVKVEGENRISSDVRLRVRGTTGNIESFRVRLPPGMELVPNDAVGYSLTLVPATDAPTGRGAPPGQIVEVRFDRPQPGIAEARLLVEQGASFAAGPLAPARIEVLGAARQRGTIDFAVEGDWHLSWKEDASVRRLDLPTDAAPAKLAARYEFSRQPCGLELSVASRPSRISVEPVHVVYVDDRQVRLETTLKVRLRGARAAGLAFELGDWQLDRLTPGELFDIGPLEPATGNSRLAAFRTGATIPSELEVKLEAHRPFDPSTNEIAFSIPRPLGDVVAPATVMIVPADNVELTPQNTKIAGLALDPSPAVARFPSRQQSPLVYRDLAADAPASFAADLRVRTRWSTASAQAKVQLDQQQMQVEQRLDYRIAYERRRTFDILIPRGVLAGRPLQVFIGDEALTPTPVADAPLVGDATRFQVVAPSDQIGLCQLVVKYSLPLPRWDRDKPITLSIPLVVPADEPHQQLGGQQLDFATSEPLSLKPDSADSDEFSRPTPTPTSAGGQLAYAWSRVSTSSRWIVEPTEGNFSPSITLGKVWIQTWLGGSARQERAAFRLTTDTEQLRLKLPGVPRVGSVYAAVNGQTVESALRQPTTLLVPLPTAARGRETVVELWYAIDDAASARGWTLAQLKLPQLKPPLLEAASTPRRLYWQVCLPGDQYLVIPPAELASETNWQAVGWPGVPRPAQSQEDLESWIGATRQDPLPRGANEYLFSTLGSAPVVSITVAGRRLILAIGAGAALVLGLALLHVRMLRRPESLLAGAVILGALALALPEAAILAAQAAALGLVIALGMALRSWLTSGRGAWVTSPASSVERPREPRSTEAREPRLDRLPGLTTAAVPVGGGAAEPSS